jgi:tRNA (guanine37-N1)-methyltransferase
MRVDVLSAVPDLLQSPFAHSILKRAIEKNIIEIVVHSIRDYTPYKHGQIDDYQYGGGAGMVMMCEPLGILIEKLKADRIYDAIIFVTPDGSLFKQQEANKLSLLQNIIIICGHYKGIDQRIRDLYVTHEISVGDYVLSGGELAAALIVDAVARLIPGVLNNETSALTDSFQDNLLAPPVYTRPQEYKGMEVPAVLMTGHQANIDTWRHEQAVLRTEQRRPDLLDS